MFCWWDSGVAFGLQQYCFFLTASQVLGLSASYLLSFVFAFAITGSQSNFEFYQRPSTISLTTAFEIFVIGLAFLAAWVFKVDLFG